MVTCASALPQPVANAASPHKMRLHAVPTLVNSSLLLFSRQELIRLIRFRPSPGSLTRLPLLEGRLDEPRKRPAYWREDRSKPRTVNCAFRRTPRDAASVSTSKAWSCANPPLPAGPQHARRTRRQRPAAPSPAASGNEEVRAGKSRVRPRFCSTPALTLRLSLLQSPTLFPWNFFRRQT